MFLLGQFFMRCEVFVAVGIECVPEEEVFGGRRRLVRHRVGLFAATSAASALALYDALLLILLVDIMNPAVYGSSRIALDRAFEGIAEERFCMNTQ